MKKNILSKVLGLLFFAGAFTLVSCDDSDDYKSLDTLALSLNQAIPDTVLFGGKLKMDVIANQASAFTLTLSPAKNPAEPVYDSTFTNLGGRFLFAGEVTVPTDSSWAGDYIIKVVSGNVEDTKKVFFKKPARSDYYLVGGASAAGWTPENGLKLMYYSEVKEEDGKQVKKEWYDIFGYFAADGLKLLPTTAGWDGGVGESKTTAGTLTTNDAKDILVPAADFYRLRVTLKNGSIEGGTYQLIPSKWGVIGDATPGEWSNDTDMTLDPAAKGSYTWTVTLPLVGGKEFKFRENDSWDMNLGSGDSGNDLKPGGGNIKVATSGTYLLTLKLEPQGYTYTIEKK
jgi:starch-binding outer membrane protein SusE/F